MEAIGFLAGSLTTLSFLPQTIMVLRTRNTAGISLAMYAIFTVGVSCWLTYGIVTSTLPIMLANGTTLCFALTILSMKVRATLKERRPQIAAGQVPVPIA